MRISKLNIPFALATLLIAPVTKSESGRKIGLAD
jgi:hypothetical protein